MLPTGALAGERVDLTMSEDWDEPTWKFGADLDIGENALQMGSFVPEVLLRRASLQEIGHVPESYRLYPVSQRISLSARVHDK